MPYKTRNGRRVKLPRSATNGIQYLIKLDGTKATFECKEGHHISTTDFGKGPVSRRIPASSLAMLSKYWWKGTGHCYGWCQVCQNAWDDLEVK